MLTARSPALTSGWPRERLAGFPGFLRANGFARGRWRRAGGAATRRSGSACSTRRCCAGACGRCCAAGATSGGASMNCSTPGSCRRTAGRRRSGAQVAPRGRGARRATRAARRPRTTRRRPRAAREPPAAGIAGPRRFPRTAAPRAHAGHRGADAPLRPPAEAHAAAPRGRGPPRPAAGPAGHHPAQRGQRRHALPPGLEGPPPRAAAAGAAAGREPLDGALQLLLPAAGARA